MLTIGNAIGTVSIIVTTIGIIVTILGVKIGFNHYSNNINMDNSEENVEIKAGDGGDAYANGDGPAIGGDGGDVIIKAPDGENAS